MYKLLLSLILAFKISWVIAQIHGHPGGGLPDILVTDERQRLCDLLQIEKQELEIQFKKLKNIKVKSSLSFDEILDLIIAEHSIKEIIDPQLPIDLSKKKDCLTCKDSSSKHKKDKEQEVLVKIEKIIKSAQSENLKCDWSKNKDIEKVRAVIKFYDEK
jgi:hypothetical protein